jgi:cytoskeletal protein RodZ
LTSTGAESQGSPEPPRAKSDSWFRRHWKELAVGAVVLVVGIGIGAAGQTSALNKKTDRIKAQAAQLQDMTTKNASLQKQVDDRTAQAAADKAHAEAVKADEQAAKNKAAADAKARADAATQARAQAAAAAKAQADAAAKAQAKALADAQAAAAAEAAKMNTIDGDGVYQIGVDVNPGQWRSSGGSGCYYAILNSPDTNDIATNNLNDGPAIAELPAGKYFDTTNCGSWTHS